MNFYYLMFGTWSIWFIGYIYINNHSNKKKFKFSNLNSRIKKGKRIMNRINDNVKDNNFFK